MSREWNLEAPGYECQALSIRSQKPVNLVPLTWLTGWHVYQLITGQPLGKPTHLFLISFVLVLLLESPLLSTDSETDVKAELIDDWLLQLLYWYACWQMQRRWVTKRRWDLGRTMRVGRTWSCCLTRCTALFLTRSSSAGVCSLRYCPSNMTSFFKSGGYSFRQLQMMMSHSQDPRNEITIIISSYIVVNYVAVGLLLLFFSCFV